MKSSQTNTFTGGMLKDLHPMTTPPNVLTDALNATIVTMNGNENVLLNDMGNAKIESAYLPAGYEPVGMKEYGGVIYVASYNPFTNKGLIGSFPSPERNVDKEELSNKLTLDIMRIFDDRDELDNYQMNKFSDSFDLFGDLIMHAGDKFSLYCNDLPKNLITHYNTYGNWDNRRNKLITLELTTLDSDKNIIKLTDTLKRFDSNGNLINFGENSTKEEKENRGYFILNIDTSFLKVTLERIKYAANTYSHKFSSKVFLTETINIIDHIELNYKKILDTNNIEFTIKYYYNCPLEYIRGCQFSDGKSTTIINFDDTQLESYNEETNLFSIENKFTLEYNDKEIINYTITPLMTFSSLKHLSLYGNIDTNKLSSGLIEIILYKYYYYDEYLKLVYGIQSYLDNQYIESINLNLYSLENLSSEPININLKSTKVSSGIFANKLNIPIGYYLAAFVVTKTNEAQPITIGWKYLFNTPIFNDLFYLVNDFLEIFNGKYSEYFKIKLKSDTLLAKDSYDINSVYTPSDIKILKEEVSDNNTYNILEKYHTNILNTLSTTLTIQNPEYYPINIDFSNINFKLNIDNLSILGRNKLLTNKVNITNLNNTSSTPVIKLNIDIDEDINNKGYYAPYQIEYSLKIQEISPEFIKLYMCQIPGWITIVMNTRHDEYGHPSLYNYITSVIKSGNSYIETEKIETDNNKNAWVKLNYYDGAGYRVINLHISRYFLNLNIIVLRGRIKGINYNLKPGCYNLGISLYNNDYGDNKPLYLNYYIIMFKTLNGEYAILKKFYVDKSPRSDDNYLDSPEMYETILNRICELFANKYIVVDEIGYKNYLLLNIDSPLYENQNLKLSGNLNISIEEELLATELNNLFNLNNITSKTGGAINTVPIFKFDTDVNNYKFIVDYTLPKSQLLNSIQITSNSKFETLDIIHNKIIDTKFDKNSLYTYKNDKFVKEDSFKDFVIRDNVLYPNASYLNKIESPLYCIYERQDHGKKYASLFEFTKALGFNSGLSLTNINEELQIKDLYAN